MPSLSDVSGTTTSLGFSDRIRRSRWWTRGWTLQELLAPTEVVFFIQGDAEPDIPGLAEWRRVGTKTELSDRIASNTGIIIDILNDPKFLGAQASPRVCRGPQAG